VKKGFGLMEVLIAAVVLGFLVIGLNKLQLGNREGVLRVRARDAANTIAQDIIDSISRIGSASLKIEKRDGVCPPPNDKRDLCRQRTFEGEAGSIPVNYWIIVDVKEGANKSVNNQTEYTKNTSSTTNKLSVTHQIAKQIDVTVKWKFKDSDQSINVSSLIK
jgi:Tfp pilus assembly protein PilV